MCHVYFNFIFQILVKILKSDKNVFIDNID